MDGVIYQKKVGEVKIAESAGEYVARRTFIVLTKEVNRLIVWELDTHGELIVIKTFPTYLPNDAIDFAVKTAAEAIESGYYNVQKEAPRG